MNHLAGPSTGATARQEVMMEYSALGNPSHCPLGMYLVPSPSDIFQWDGLLFLHRGYYASSLLRFTLSIPASYPSSPPTLTFHTPIFHPLVDPASGQMSLTSRFPQWRPRVDFLFHVLHFVKSAFKRAGLDGLREAQCVNREAYRLYRDQTPLFATLAAQSAALSITDSSLYSSIPGRGSGNGIQFRPLAPGEEEKLRKELEEGVMGRVVARGVGGVRVGG